MIISHKHSTSQQSMKSVVHTEENENTVVILT